MATATKKKRNPCLGCKTKEKQYCEDCIFAQRETDIEMKNLVIAKNEKRRRKQPKPERN